MVGYGHFCRGSDPLWHPWHIRSCHTPTHTRLPTPTHWDTHTWTRVCVPCISHVVGGFWVRNEDNFAVCPLASHRPVSLCPAIALSVAHTVSPSWRHTNISIFPVSGKLSSVGVGVNFVYFGHSFAIEETVPPAPLASPLSFAPRQPVSLAHYRLRTSVSWPIACVNTRSPDIPYALRAFHTKSVGCTHRRPHFSSPSDARRPWHQQCGQDKWMANSGAQLQNCNMNNRLPKRGIHTQKMFPSVEIYKKRF